MSQLAKRFDVSFGWARKISATLRSTGKMERPPGGPRGPSSKLTDAMREDLRNWIAKQSDLTLAELQVRLYEQFYSAAFAILYSAAYVKDRDSARRCSKGHPVGALAQSCERCGNP